MLEHILRRMGFGASPQDMQVWSAMDPSAVMDRLLNYESQPTNIDSRIGDPAFVNITTQVGRPFSPNTLINDARQRWLFRMVHSPRPLEEKMALFWHNHFATAYSKIAGAIGQERATRAMDNHPASLAGSPPGQIQLFRQHATGSFRDLLLAVSKDPAMIYWLDMQLNTRTRPQENFGREIMELFSMGIGNYTEADVYAAARVFTGVNWQVVGDRLDLNNSYYTYLYRANDHDVNAKEFTFAIYPDGGKVIPARPAAQGEQDMADFVNAVARHPATARRLATRLYKFFVSETTEPNPTTINTMSQVYLANDTSIKAMLRILFVSSAFRNPDNFFQRYSWPVEYVVRAIKETGWQGFSVNNAITPLSNMGQNIYEPPDVNGWELGPGWFSTSSMLQRMNFSAALAQNQRFNLARDAQPHRANPDRVVEYVLSRFQTMGFHGGAQAAMAEYMRTSAWTGSDAQLQQKVPGLARLIVGSGEYQFN
ncbi:MAG TPA: DUF1800 domain-containing protein [Vicinamibacterales bacterium]|nr:DUF1800 domain-containing protein [Vicinamibacterales bacterium]